MLYTKIIVRLSHSNNHNKTLDLSFILENNSFVPLWIDRYKQAQQRGDPISEPWAFYNLNNDWTDEKIVTRINNRIDYCNDWVSVFTRKLNDIDDQDCLNHIHSVFELCHGKLDEWKTNPLFDDKPAEFRQSLSEINQLVHRAESHSTSKKLRVVWFDLPKTEMFTDDHYKLFTNYVDFGGLYSLYADVGKNLESLARDNDVHHHDLVPNLHYSVDFVVKFNTITDVTKLEKLCDDYKKTLKHSIYTKDDIRLTTGSIKIAQLEFESEDDILEKIAQYNHIQSVYVI